jgi:hypothetical protein
MPIRPAVNQQQVPSGGTANPTGPCCANGRFCSAGRTSMTIRETRSRAWAGCLCRWSSIRGAARRQLSNRSASTWTPTRRTLPIISAPACRHAIAGRGCMIGKPQRQRRAPGVLVQALSYQPPLPARGAHSPAGDTLGAGRRVRSASLISREWHEALRDIAQQPCSFIGAGQSPVSPEDP